MRRRTFVGSAAALAGATAMRPFVTWAQSRPLAYADMHSHIGFYGGRVNLRELMIKHGMLVIAQKIVADSSVIRRTPGKGTQQVREPAPGELASRFDRALARLRAEHKSDDLTEIVDSKSLQRIVGGAEPAVVIAAEGADFLDGDLKRLEAARRDGLVHLQLVHYRVSDIGDISTDRPLHNGLTAFGKEVVAACDRLGILVDVAHCTSEGIAHALEASTKPMIYSHGHVISMTPHWTLSAVRARAIGASYARRIAEKGGVIGIWPLGSQYRSLDAYMGALLDTIETVGAAHVGIGSDLLGLPSSVMPGYEQFSELEQLLAKRGLKPENIGGILGGNYLRVLGQTLSA